MKEKVKRILDLVRAGKLTLDDAAPLLAALSTKLALQGSDRELIDSLLSREDLDTGQVAEHLLLLRGIKETPPAPPQPPRPPQWSWGDSPEDHAWASHEARAEAHAERARARAARRGGGIEGMVERITDTVERAVETAMEGVDRTMTGSSSYSYDKRSGPTNRILKIDVESTHGDEYSANIPISLAPHLHKLIPPHGIAALEAAGFSLDTLQLLIESNPPSGDLIKAEDAHGNEVHISIK